MIPKSFRIEFLARRREFITLLGGAAAAWPLVAGPQQSLSDFVSAMEAAGMLVRVTGEKRVDELPR